MLQPPVIVPLRGLRWKLARVALATTVALVAITCGDSTPPVESDQLASRVDSRHFTYLSAAGDVADTTWMETYIAWLSGALKVDALPKLEFHKYRDRQHMQAITGRVTNGFAEPGTVRFHTIWPQDNHEVVHVVAILKYGHPPALFNEGIAVAHQMIPPEGIFYAQWNRRNVHTIAAEALVAKRIPDLGSILESRTFFSFDESLMYPVSGSFVRYLIDSRGLDRLRSYMSASTFDDQPGRTRALFEAAYGETLDKVWSSWLASLVP
jgi:hypothetical protein